jgi:hypothetical protein
VQNIYNSIKGAINNAYFTAFLVLKYIIDLSACKLLYFPSYYTCPVGRHTSEH